MKVTEALVMADRLGFRQVGIDLNAALVGLTGEGMPPPDAAIEGVLLPI